MLKTIAFASALALIAATPSPAPLTIATHGDAEYQNVVNAYNAQQRATQAFVQSVYAPYCAAHKGFVGVALIGEAKDGVKPAWPAVVSCKDGHVSIVKSPLEKPL